MKRILILGLSVLIVLMFCGTALATDVEINYPNVNIRKTPAGNPIGMLAGGEILPALDETWADGQMWYHVQTEQFGDGYVNGEFARPVYGDERVFDPDNPTSPKCMTENVTNFYTSLFRWLYVYDYCYWDNDEGCTYRVHNGVGDEKVVKPIHKWDIAYMMARYGLLVESEEVAVIKNTDASSEEKIAAASTVLKNHFGTDDLWTILVSRNLIGYSEAHIPHRVFCSSSDTMTILNISKTVDAEFREKTSGRTSEVLTDGDLVLYYNPDGGSRYHVDMNCPSTNPKYLPFKGQFRYSEVNDDAYIQLMPCNVCNAPLREKIQYFAPLRKTTDE